jgi:tagatose-1,6-bisphosphate aldolase non-catalytic subunit AgaZ/GatZ
MLLGSIIANLSDETSILETLASLDDLVLMARLREAAAEAGEPLGCFARAAVGSFVARADDAAWLSLMAVTSKADDPGRACLRYILGTEVPVPAPSCSCRH